MCENGVGVKLTLELHDGFNCKRTHSKDNVVNTNILKASWNHTSISYRKEGLAHSDLKCQNQLLRICTDFNQNTCNRSAMSQTIHSPSFIAIAQREHV